MYSTWTECKLTGAFKELGDGNIQKSAKIIFCIPLIVGVFKPFCQWRMVVYLCRCTVAAQHECAHYSDVIMNAMTSQITGVSIDCTTLCSGADQRKHQSSASLVHFPHEGLVTPKMLPFDDVTMSQWGQIQWHPWQWNWHEWFICGSLLEHKWIS